MKSLRAAVAAAALSVAAQGQTQGPLDQNFNMRNIRIFVDISQDPAHWPRTNSTDPNARIGYTEVERAVRISMGLWQSVLPDLQVSFVGREGEANLVMRWRNYYPYCMGGGPCNWSGISFFSGSWNPNPDLSCGRDSAGRSANLASGCTEISNNVIAFRSALGVGVSACNYTHSRHAADYFASAADPAKLHFRDASRGDLATAPERVNGSVPGSSWDAGITDFVNAANWSRVPYDMILLIAHEFGHTLGIAHQQDPWGDYWVWSRRPVLQTTRFFRDPHSIMYKGGGGDIWNQRGIFDMDARIVNALGYRVGYPHATGTLKLMNAANQIFLTSDWREAAGRMVWPGTGGQPTSDPAQYFLVDIFPRAAARSRLTAGLHHAAGLHADGNLRGWGRNLEGQLGNAANANTGVPVEESGANSRWVSVDGGHYHTLGIRADGSLWSWGYNEHGELGAGFLGAGTNRNTPQREATLSATGWFDAKAGAGHSIALRKDGTVWAWGWGEHNQNGRGDHQNSHTPTRMTVYSGSIPFEDVVSIAAGGDHNLALRANGDVVAWGRNDFGQTGVPGAGAWIPPTMVMNDPNVIAVSAGWLHSLFLMRDGSVWASGYNGDGELGMNDRTDRHTPGRVSGLFNIVAVSAGSWHNLAVGHDGALYAWGWGQYGQLGGSTSEDNLVPRRVGTDRDWVAVAAGERFSLAMKRDGRVYSFGDNSMGQLASGAVGGLSPTPLASRWAVPAMPRLTRVSAPTSNLRPTWSWSSGGGGNGTYRYRLDNADLSSGTTQVTGTSFTPTADLTAGAHTLYVQERNALGFWSAAASERIVIDRTAPVPTPHPGADPRDGRFWIPFSVNENSNVFYTTNGTAPTAASLRACALDTESSGCDPLDPGNSVPRFGNYLLRYFAVDRAGNASAIQQRQVFGARINFQPSGAAVPNNYLVDNGAAYASRGGGFSYGWNTTNTGNTRDRNALTDQRYDTFNHMQLGGAFTWEIGVPNGTYYVHLVAGDPTLENSVYRMNAEGVLVVNGTPTAANRFVEGRGTVTVSDGRLTVSNGSGAVNNKLAFLEIFRTSP